jgi:hypothetical protein
LLSIGTKYRFSFCNSYVIEKIIILFAYLSRYESSSKTPEEKKDDSEEDSESVNDESEEDSVSVNSENNSKNDDSEANSENDDVEDNSENYEIEHNSENDDGEEDSKIEDEKFERIPKDLNESSNRLINKRKADNNYDSISYKKQKGEIKKKREQSDIIDISGFQPKAVKTLFEYLKGYTELMDKSSFSVKVEILALCEHYVIVSPIQRIKMDIVDTNISTENLLDAFHAASNLFKLDHYNRDAEELKEMICTFCSNHFSSWKKIVEFILKNKSSMDTIVQIFQDMQNISMIVQR